MTYDKLKFQDTIKNIRNTSLFGFAQTTRANLNFYITHPMSIIARKRYFDAARLELKNIARDTFFIIAIPGSLHLVELCLKFVPPHVKIAIISNGLSDFENEWMKKNLRFEQLITLPSVFLHGDVIDLLVKNVKYPFGILDYDCFVFRPELFNEALNIDKKDQLNAFFYTANQSLNLEIPSTFFLYINAPVYRELISKYGINCTHYAYFQLPQKAREKLRTMGIDGKHRPESFKNYFDTLQALMMIGVAEGYSINFKRKFPSRFTPSDEIFHVGGVSDPNSHKHLWGVRGSYLWRFALEHHRDDQLRNYYEKTYGVKSPDDVLNTFPNSRRKIGDDFFKFVEDLIKYN